MRLIDGDALTETLGITDMDCNKCAWCDKEWSRCKRGSDFEDACCAIENAPTIEERKTGRWRRRLVDSGFNADWHCSECGWKTSLEEHGYNFCPNCGADMREQP